MQDSASSGPPKYGLEECREDLDYYREEFARAETALVGIGSQIDWWRRANVDSAVDTIQALLDDAARRPDAWETPHVNALEDVLRSILQDLGVTAVVEPGGPPRGRWASDHPTEE